jgi:hypothetical protein
MVKNPESLLETIRSRTINLYTRSWFDTLSTEITWALDNLLCGKVNNLLELVQSWKLDEWTILLILFYLINNCQKEHLERLQQGIDDLLEVHENPRNILDRVILFM